MFLYLYIFALIVGGILLGASMFLGADEHSGFDEADFDHAFDDDFEEEIEGEYDLEDDQYGEEFKKEFGHLTDNADAKAKDKKK